MTPSEAGLVALLDSVKSFEQTYEIGPAFNIFDAVGMSTQEIRHSRFLAFLLNPLGSHGLGEYFLRTFLDHVMSQSEAPPMTRLAVMLADLSAAEVYTERDHFDITVWMPQQRLLLVIENKIGASESEGQLLKYRERVKQQYPEENFCGVFLTADGYDGEDPGWISVSYDTVFSQLQAMLQDSAAALATDVHMAIKHYSQLIRKYIVTDKELIEACRSIYAKHRAALDLIIEHGQVSLVREAAQQFLAETPELQPAPGGNYLRVNTVGATWEGIPSFQVADASSWGPAYPLQFWFKLEEQRSRLNFVVEVGPVRADSAFDRSRLVLELRSEFGAPDKTISSTYTRIKRYSRTVSEVDEIDSILQSMKALWADFGGPERLKRIDNVVRNIAG